jgi:hypothetical protein
MSGERFYLDTAGDSGTGGAQVTSYRTINIREASIDRDGAVYKEINVNVREASIYRDGAVYKDINVNVREASIEMGQSIKR